MKMIRKLLVYAFVFLLCAMGFSQESESRPKVGLVLSGGGARGFAHIGTLALIDSLNIPIDYIAGTSMGGIIGALYSIGYDAVEIERLIRRLEWQQLFSDEPPREMVPYYERKYDGRFQFKFEIKNGRPVAPDGLISGQKILLALSELTYAYENVEHFDDLPIPYRCITVDLITGKEVVLDSGSLSKAIRATMSIPTLFDPVAWGDSLLIDGGLLNNVPVDVVKEMGADIVITSNVGRTIRNKDELNTILEILEQTIFISEYAREEENLPLSDLTILPKIHDLNAADFREKNVDAIIQAGKNAADLNRKSMEALAEKYQLSAARSEFALKKTKSRLFGIQVRGNTSLPFNFLYELTGMSPGDFVDAASVEERMRSMRKSERVKDVKYTAFMNSKEDVSLNIHVIENEFPIISGLVIRGNQRLSYSYIVQLLNIHSGDPFIPEVIANQITQLYSLGVFENIRYEIEPIDSKMLRMILVVEEKATDVLKVGLRYDNYFNLVGVLGIKHEHFLVPGLRLEGQYQFAGLGRYETRVTYPINIKDFIAYPMLRFYTQNEPRTIYEAYGDQIAVYKDRRSQVGIGLGMHPRTDMVIEVDLTFEETDVSPEVGQSNLPEWQDKFGYLNVFICIDDLDDILIPTTGNLIDFRYEYSTSSLAGDQEYSRYEITWDSYNANSRRDNIRLRGRLGVLDGDEDIYYKGFYSMGPNDFVGLDYYELAWKRILLARVDYRRNIGPDWYLKFSYNIAPNPVWNGERLYPFEVNSLSGVGASLLYNSLLGPIEFTLSLGEKLDAEGHKTWEQHNYFTAGFKF